MYLQAIFGVYVAQLDPEQKLAESYEPVAIGIAKLEMLGHLVLHVFLPFAGQVSLWAIE